MKTFKSIRNEAEWKKETPWRKVKPGDKKDKYGNTVKDKNVARNLARSAMKKTAAGKTEEVEEGKKSSANNQKILRIIGSAQNMDQAIKMVMKSHNADEKKAKMLVHRAVRSAFYDEMREGAMSKDKEKHDTGGFRISNADAKAARARLAARRKQKAQKSASQNKSFKNVRDRLK